MTENEKIDMLISEIRELRKAIEELSEYFEKQLDFMVAEFKRFGFNIEAPGLTVVGAENPDEEKNVSGAEVMVLPTPKKRTPAGSSKKVGG